MDSREFANKNYVLSVWLPQLCKWPWWNQKQKRLLSEKYVKTYGVLFQRVLDSGLQDQTIAQILVPARRV